MPVRRHSTSAIRGHWYHPPRNLTDSAASYGPGRRSVTDTLRHIYRGHENASAVTNSKGVTVYFDPDSHEVLGFAIEKFSEYYKANADDQGEFPVDLPARVPSNLQEEMDFDAEAVTSGVRIAEFY